MNLLIKEGVRLCVRSRIEGEGENLTTGNGHGPLVGGRPPDGRMANPPQIALRTVAWQ